MRKLIRLELRHILPTQPTAGLPEAGEKRQTFLIVVICSAADRIWRKARMRWSFPDSSRRREVDLSVKTACERATDSHFSIHGT
jgi:hypothetical protein